MQETYFRSVLVRKIWKLGVYWLSIRSAIYSHPCDFQSLEDPNMYRFKRN